MADIKKLASAVLKFRDERNWKQFHNPKDVSISLALEAAELLEHFQWKTPAEIAAHIKTEKEAISDELADVLYWVLVLGHDLKIDLAAALKQKLVKNAVKYPVSKSRGRITKYNKL
ncbi:MAG TPA: nucleotide pyrophosphohydrolase [Elusimicrobia bacterium]|nr:MAG: nucleotide pyrophosphohydrolase [Elusimicrobia bacterium GWD2_63_28]HCC48922.1 nucleotide pyrophosphohydrolase [Elusimicrobiota bacterium]